LPGQRKTEEGESCGKHSLCAEIRRYAVVEKRGGREEEQVWLKSLRGRGARDLRREREGGSSHAGERRGVESVDRTETQ